MTDVIFQPGQQVRLNERGLRWKTPRPPKKPVTKWKNRVGETGHTMMNRKIVFVKWEGNMGHHDQVPVQFIEAVQ